MEKYKCCFSAFRNECLKNPVRRCCSREIDEGLKKSPLWNLHEFGSFAGHCKFLEIAVLKNPQNINNSEAVRNNKP